MPEPVVWLVSGAERVELRGHAANIALALALRQHLLEPYEQVRLEVNCGEGDATVDIIRARLAEVRQPKRLLAA